MLGGDAATGEIERILKGEAAVIEGNPTPGSRTLAVGSVGMVAIPFGFALVGFKGFDAAKDGCGAFTLLLLF